MILDRLVSDLHAGLFERVLLPAIEATNLDAYVEPLQHWSWELMLGSLQVGLTAAVLRPLELWRPVERWSTRRPLRADVLYTALDRLGLNALLFFVTLGPAMRALEGLLRRAGYTPWTIDQRLAAAGWDGPLWSIAVYLVLLDLVDYVVHRAQHRMTAWWALHGVHHSQTHLSFWAEDRHHVLDRLLTDAWRALVALAVGVPGAAFIFVTLITRAVESLAHANVRLSFGWLGDRLLVSPSYHRMHHAAGVGHEGPARGCNFASIFPVWDLVSRTARFSAEPMPTGIGGPSPPDYGADWGRHQVRGVEELRRVFRRAVGA